MQSYLTHTRNSLRGQREPGHPADLEAEPRKPVKLLLLSVFAQSPPLARKENRTHGGLGTFCSIGQRKIRQGWVKVSQLLPRLRGEDGQTRLVHHQRPQGEGQVIANDSDELLSLSYRQFFRQSNRNDRAPS